MGVLACASVSGVCVVRGWPLAAHKSVSVAAGL